MTMKNLTKKLLLLLAVPVILYGCAAQELPDVVWPKPPAEPRVKFVKTYVGSGDFEKSSVAAELVLGAGGNMTVKKPMGVHVDSNGKIFVADTALTDIHVWDPENSSATSFARQDASYFSKPISVATDSQGRMFVTDSTADKVAVFDKEYKLTAYLNPETPFKQPSGIAVDEKNNRLYVTDTHNHHVVVFELDSLEYLEEFGTRGKGEGQFNFPSMIDVDDDGHLYVVDTMNARVQIFDSEGFFLRTFGQFGDSPGMFARPKGVAVDSEGHIYVTDAAFNNVQIFNQEGQVLMMFSGFGSGRGQVILPAGIAIDDEDFIYVADSWNERVQVFEYLGEKHKAREASGSAG